VALKKNSNTLNTSPPAAAEFLLEFFPFQKSRFSDMGDSGKIMHLIYFLNIFGIYSQEVADLRTAEWLKH
jgi:hypothetical protein